MTDYVAENSISSLNAETPTLLSPQKHSKGKSQEYKANPPQLLNKMFDFRVVGHS